MKRLNFLLMGMGAVLLTVIEIALAYNKNQVHGAEIYSIDSVKYGRFEVKMKVDGGKGTLSSFFLYNHNSHLGGNFPWSEIDLELMGKTSEIVHTNIITGTNENRVMSEQKQNVKANVPESFHEYAIEWLPNYVAWYMDGILIRKSSLKDNPQIAELQDKYLSYRFNVWPCWKYLVYQTLSSPKNKIYQTVDYIKYYAYHPQKEVKFELCWCDNFNALDTTRWGLADWTFPGNKSVFSPNNVRVAHGMLYLKMTQLQDRPKSKLSN